MSVKHEAKRVESLVLLTSVRLHQLLHGARRLEPESYLAFLLVLDLEVDVLGCGIFRLLAGTAWCASLFGHFVNCTVGMSGKVWQWESEYQGDQLREMLADEAIQRI